MTELIILIKLFYVFGPFTAIYYLIANSQRRIRLIKSLIFLIILCTLVSIVIAISLNFDEVFVCVVASISGIIGVFYQDIQFYAKKLIKEWVLRYIKSFIVVFLLFWIIDHFPDEFYIYKGLLIFNTIPWFIWEMKLKINPPKRLMSDEI